MSIFLPNSSDKSAELRQKQKNVKEMDKVIKDMLRERNPNRKSGRKNASRRSPMGADAADKGKKNTRRDEIEKDDGKAFN